MAFILVFFLSLPGGPCLCASAPLALQGRYDYSKGWYHRVIPGDTLGAIARKYSRSPHDLARINKIDPNGSLKPGSYIFIPPPADKGQTSGQNRQSASPPPSRSSPLPKPPPVPPMSPRYSPSRSAPGTPVLAKQISRPPSSPRVSSSSATSSRPSDGVGYQWPLEGRVTREYQTNKESPHKGLDIEAPPGTTVRAARSGKVIYADGGIPSYGLMVIIDHDDKMSTVYAHNSEILVAVGDQVRAGQAVAKVGRTGRATTDHLHFEIRRDALPVNPRNFLPKQ